MRFHLLLALLFYVLAALRVPAAAQEESTTVSSEAAKPQLSSSGKSDVELQIRTMDRQIVLELLKLAEFNVRYEQTVNHYARWRTVFYPSAQEATYAGFLGFSVTDMSQRFRARNNPALVSVPSLKRGLSSATVGALLGGTSSLAELVADGAETIRANRRGFSARDSVAFVHSQVKRVDDMLARRHSLMAELDLTGTRRELLELKEQLLAYERDRLVFEFKRWSVHSRGYAWYKNTFYVINATVNASRFSAALLAFKSFTDPPYRGSVGPILLASTFLAGVGPTASGIMKGYIERRQARRLSSELPGSQLLSDKEAKQKLERLAQLLEMNEARDQNSQLASELIRLREETIGLDTLVYHEERNIQRFRKVVGLQKKIVPFLAMEAMASNIVDTVAYFGYRNRPLTSNRMRFAGDVIIIPAEGIALTATPAAAISTYTYEGKLKRKGEHPDQLLPKRLKEIKAMQAIVEAWR
jgi:hypothetical protein